MKFWPRRLKPKSLRVNGEYPCLCTNTNAGNAERPAKNSSGLPPTFPNSSALPAEAANSRNGFRALLLPENLLEPVAEAVRPRVAAEAGDETAVCRKQSIGGLQAARRKFRIPHSFGVEIEVTSTSFGSIATARSGPDPDPNPEHVGQSP